jgi:hypothetical protein
MKNVHLIEAKQPCRLHYYNYLDHLGLSKENLQWKQGRNIYITSEEDIKEEHLTKEIYVIDIQNGNIGKLTCKNRFFKGSSKLIEIEWKNKQNIWNYNHIREIILTTDQDLIKDGVQDIPDEFLEWFVKNPSCEGVGVEKEKVILGEVAGTTYTDFNYKIIIPKEEPNPFELQKTLPDDVFYESLEPKQETLEEAAYRLSAEKFEPKHIAFMLGVIEGAKWQQEQDMNKYSEEEVFKLLMEFSSRDINSSSGTPHSIAKWFEQFKNKEDEKYSRNPNR